MSDYCEMVSIVKARIAEMQAQVEASKPSVEELYEEYAKVERINALLDELGIKHCGKVY